ncbi:hypothetical protein VPH35_116972 [Triticum aestivum]
MMSCCSRAFLRLVPSCCHLILLFIRRFHNPLHADIYILPFVKSKQYPICVTINKQFILEQAIETIGGTIHPFTFTDIGSDDVGISVSIDLPPHSKSLSSTTKEFHGPCIESMCVAALG